MAQDSSPPKQHLPYPFNANLSTTSMASFLVTLQGKTCGFKAKKKKNKCNNSHEQSLSRPLVTFYHMHQIAIRRECQLTRISFRSLHQYLSSRQLDRSRFGSGLPSCPSSPTTSVSGKSTPSRRRSSSCRHPASAPEARRVTTPARYVWKRSRAICIGKLSRKAPRLLHY